MPVVIRLRYRKDTIRMLFCLLLPIVFSNTAHADQPLRVAVYQGEGMPLAGFARDIMTAVSREYGWELSFQDEHYAEALSALENNEVDLVLNVPFVDPYVGKFVFSDYSLFNDWSELYTSSGSSLDAPLDLEKKRIGVPEKGPQLSAVGEILQHFHLETEVFPFASPAEAARAVANREVDAAVLSRAFSLRGAQGFAIEKMPYSFAPHELRVAAADGSLSQVLAAIDSYLSEGRRDGSSPYFAVYDRWFPRDRDYHPPAYLSWLIVAIVASLLAFFVGRLTAGARRRKIGELENHVRKLELEGKDHDTAQRHLHQLAYYDEITSLPNRLLFNERLHAAMIDESGVSVAMLDLDRFKSFNDTLGHETGNALLRLVAKRIGGALPEHVLLARHGGDEFSLLISGGGPTECASVAKSVQDALRRPVTELGSELYVTASIGLSHYPTEAKNIPELLQQADIAMYRAKVEGGGTYCLYDADIGESIVSRMELETSMRRALVKGEMWLEYQPQVDLETDRILAVEALLRWQHPERGLMDTSEFIRVAEETGQIITIGEWVMEEVFAQAAQWREKGIGPFKLAINLSSKQVQKRDFAQFVRQLMEEYDFPSEMLELEITEHVLIENERQTRETMNALKDLGVSLAIDDFGTGYSALSYLHRFPIDTLKIDKSFVASLHMNDNNKAITSAIVAMAERLDLRTVAECVEKHEQVAILGEMQCQAAQGFYFAEPLTQDKFAEWVKSRFHPGRLEGNRNN